MKKLIPIVCGLIVAHLATPAMAEEGFLATLAQGKTLRFQFSPYTYHFTPDDEHSDVVMVGLERERQDGKLDGAVLFSNSFGQPTIYVYPWGDTYREILGVKKLSFKWTAGLMYGYKDPYKDKVPLNYGGFNPVVIPALAYDFESGWSAQLNLLGNAAMMFQFSKQIN
jgi:hypothetical protein